MQEMIYASVTSHRTWIFNNPAPGNMFKPWLLRCGKSLCPNGYNKSLRIPFWNALFNSAVNCYDYVALVMDTWMEQNGTDRKKMR